MSKDYLKLKAVRNVIDNFIKTLIEVIPDASIDLWFTVLK